MKDYRKLCEPKDQKAYVTFTTTSCRKIDVAESGSKNNNNKKQIAKISKQ